MGKIIGLSFSRCVAAIARDEESPEDVVKIYTSTRISTNEAWKAALLWHQQHRWQNDNPHLCMQIAVKLIKAKKIIQPWITKGVVPEVISNDKIWILESEEGKIVWIQAPQVVQKQS